MYMYVCTCKYVPINKAVIKLRIRVHACWCACTHVCTCKYVCV